MSQIDILSIDIKIKEEFKKEYSNLNSYKNKCSPAHSLGGISKQDRKRQGRDSAVNTRK